MFGTGHPTTQQQNDPGAGVTDPRGATRNYIFLLG